MPVILKARARNSLDSCHSARARAEESMHFGPMCHCPLWVTRRLQARWIPTLTAVLNKVIDLGRPCRRAADN